MNLPVEYQAVEQQSIQSNLLRTILSLRIARRVINTIPDGFVLVKMASAPFNPSDIAFMQGSYHVKKTMPAVPGFEGAGRVVLVGRGVDDALLGQKVACFAGKDTDGTWAEYLLARPSQLLVVDESMDWEQTATFLVNPFTASALFRLALDSGASAFALNAAGSSVAQWMRLLAKKQGMEVINIVRKPETQAKLLAGGCPHVLLQTDVHFEKELTRLSHALDCRIAFDAVGGKLGGLLLNALPDKSKLVVYGGLSNQPLGELDVLGIIFREKTVQGFDLNQWWASANAETKQKMANELDEVRKATNNPVNISQVFDIQNVVEGIRYYLGHMSEGKVLLRLGEENPQ